MKIAPKMTIKIPIKELTTYYLESMAHPLEDLIPFEKKLRVSGFPFCGLQMAYKKLSRHVPPIDNAMKSYYCGVGTVAHEVFQRWLGSRGSIYGDWTCTNPKCKVTLVECSNKNKCPKCKIEMRYEEFTVRAFKHVTGHLDGIFRDRYGRYWVIDYKTSSVKALESQKLLPTLPYKKNVVQVETYSALIEREYNIEISGWMLLYIARDDPRQVKVYGGTTTKEQKAKTIQTIKIYDKQYDIVLNLSDIEHIDYLIKTKPCKTHDYYLENFQGFEGCPVAPVCFSKSVLRELMQSLLEEY